MRGPILTDETFFNECINWSLPDLEELRKAVSQEDFERAKAIFASYIRKSLCHDTFDQIPYEVPENQYKSDAESEIEAADRIVNMQLMACGIAHQFEQRVDWLYNPTYNQYSEWVWQLNRHNEWKLLAHVYRQTGDERYAQAFFKLFTSWVAQAVEPGPVKGTDTMLWRTIECGIRMGATWPYAFHTFVGSEACSDQVIVDWYKSLVEHGKRLREHHTTGNWFVMEMNGLGHIGVLAPILKASEEWQSYAFQQLEIELDRQLYEDGFQYELSTGYHEVFINNYVRLIRTAKTYGHTIPASFYKKLENAVLVHIALMLPDGRTPDINDARWDDVSELMKSKIALFPNNPQIRWAATRGEEGSMPDYNSIALANAGIMVMRTGWSIEDSWVLFDAAPFGYAHQHEDKLSVLFYSHGKLLLTEGGNYPYDDSKMRQYILSTRSHNTIRVDGQDQNRRKHYHWQEEDIKKSSEMNGFISEDYDIAQGIYGEGYGEEALPLATHMRTIYFMKNYGWLKNVLIVVDDLSSEEPRQYELLWHLDVEDAIIKNHKLVSKEINILTSADDSQLRIISGQTQPEWQGFRPRSFVQDDYEPIPTLQQIVKGTTLRLVTAFIPNQDYQVKITKIEDLMMNNEKRIRIHNEVGEVILLPILK